ncbi:MAG: transglutaminase domain-containing protein, partial [Candidatus Delongbacteria bacterium]|nr:transglutaminase domain-containing protein [Candidatus Delongbacteria bacterium]MCG2760419.1 transglutaminase domain-containing protein [Candidatus Delongbacteria bacterium]
IKQGHCELFATLSCLIYRRLGFPSRYVTGYYISEYNEFEEKYIGRKKDRHAWIFVWDNKGNWREFDPTPPDITAFRTKPSFFNRIYDLISYLYYKAFMFKKDNNDLFRNLLLYSLIPLGLFLLYRILKDVKPYKQKDSRKNINPYKRIPELKIIDEKFRSKGLVPENETVGNWFKRLQNILSDSGNLNKIKKLYYKKRYGEYKLRTEEKKDFLNSLERVKKGE